MIRSVQQLTALHPGYDTERVLTLRVNLPRLAPPPAADAKPDPRTVVTVRDVVRRLGQIPSVESVAIATDVPLAGSNATFFTAEGQPPVTAQNVPRAYVHRVSAEFFRTMRIPMLAGRTFNESEMQGVSDAVIVTEALVRRFWPGKGPIGKRMKQGGAGSKNPWQTIVGVVNDMKYRALPNNPTNDPDIFWPVSERQRGFAILLRTSLDPASLAPAARRVLREAEPASVIYDVVTMRELASRETARSRFTGWLMGIFAASALLLAMIGIYGVMSYAVTRRTQEIGIRMALGAARGEVLGMILRNGMRLIAAGLLLGAAAAFPLTRLIDTLLYGVAPGDPIAFLAAAGALAAVALLACLLPAARATRIAPASALRNE
jgi:predicted permease